MTIQPEYRRSAEDTLAILDVVGRYGFVVDDRDWDGFAQVFTDDAVFDSRDHDSDPPRGFAPITGASSNRRGISGTCTSTPPSTWS